MSDAPPTQGKADEEFTLFDNEERVIAEAEAMIHHLHEVARGVQNLADAYRKSYREQSRIMRLSDRMQRELQTAKHRLSEQATALQALNASLATEIEERTRLTEELQRTATIDSLTGAYSRRHLFDLGVAILRQHARTGEPLSALIIDLDHFKRINDTLGHGAGDTVLRHFAEICRGAVRKNDVFARYGGEEFVILLPGSGITEAIEIAERIRTALADRPIMTDTGEVAVTASAGAATHDREGTLERLLARADAALYEAKRAGRNRTVASESLH
jgi:diguanylate cyclase (GGDEF)-like protein